VVICDTIKPEIIANEGRIMGRIFSSADAKKLAKQYAQRKNQLQQAVRLSESMKESIRITATNLREQVAIPLLKEIPVEEINRDKKGFKIKLLEERGYKTVYDLHKASVHSISAIHGIGEETARKIKNEVAVIVKRSGANVKIRLSADNKSREATALVSALYAYRTKTDAVEFCCRFLEQNNEALTMALRDIQPGTGGLKWLFASGEKKVRCEQAYSYLQGMELYAAECDEYLKILTRGTNSADAWKDFVANTAEYITLLELLLPDMVGSENTVFGLPDDLAEELQEEALLTDGLKCTLRKYQEWGVKYILHQKRVLLGDEMGLGKTVQAIATMVSLKNAGATHFMVVCPASVVINWCREVEKHSILKAFKIHGSQREEVLKEWQEQGGVGVTTYETLGIVDFASFPFSLLIVDEAHYIKNPEAQRTENTVRLSLNTDRILFMTGTALENKVDEMISLVEILKPEVAKELKKIAFLSSAPEFREKIAPVYYRRKREDVLTELPDLIEKRKWCTLTPQEEAVYEEAVISQQFAKARQVSWNVDDLQYSSKAGQLKEIVEWAKEDGRKVVVFSFFLKTIESVIKCLGNVCMEPINGSVLPAKRQEIIDTFEKAPAGAVLPAQIQAGGTGLNIQSASVVVLCEPQFKPSIENQAISRAYRMGQARNVLVYRLLCEDTVEERIMQLLESKQAIFDTFADDSVAAERDAYEIDQNSFGEMLSEEAERIRQKKQTE